MHSNCLFEAIKVKIINPWQNKICKRGSWLEIFQGRWPHFYWHHKPSDKYYHYSQKDALSWLHQVWYEGDIAEFTWHNKPYKQITHSLARTGRANKRRKFL